MLNFIYISLMAALLIAVIAAVRFFTVHRLPKKTFYVLWSIALCRLVIPFDFLARLNISAYINGFIEKLSGLKEMFVKIPEAEILTNSANITDAITETASPSVFYDIYDTASKFGKDMFGKIDMLGSNVSATPNAASQTLESAGQTTGFQISPLLMIWLAGFLACAAYFVVTHIKFRRKYDESLPVDSTFVRSWRVERSDRTRRKVKIRQSDLLVSPLTYGILKPVILLPKTTDYNNEKKLEYILLHEYTHIKRFDTLAKLLLAAALCLHWFNPFVWLMYVLANRDIELLCDETVVREVSPGKNAKSDYALTLVELAEKKRAPALISHFSRNILKERIKSIMKLKKASKARILLAVMLVSIVTVSFAALQSCDEDDIDINPGNFENSANNISEKISDTKPEKIQEQSDKLVIYIHPFNEDFLTPALNIFKAKYPEVEVDLREWGAGAIEYIEGVGAIGDSRLLEEYHQVLRTELMAGKGPDLIVGWPSEINDLYKVMDAGIFADLNPFIENDNEFNLDNYNKVVLDSSVYKGKRYIMPLEYRVPVLMTTKEILDAEGIKPSDLSTFDGFIGTINRYNEKYKDNPKKSIFKNDSPNAQNLINYAFPWCGIDLIDYENGKVKTDDPRFETVMDAMKWAYAQKKDEVWTSTSGPSITVDALKNQEWLFDFEIGSIASFIAVHGYLLDANLSPLFFSYPNIDNKTTANVQTIAAIPKASQNQINAYNLLKILLSEDIQSNQLCVTYKPVLNSSAKTIFEQVRKFYREELGQKNMPEEEFNKYINMLAGADSCKIMAFTSDYDFLIKDMGAYYEGKQTFEQFADVLKNKLELYLSE